MSRASEIPAPLASTAATPRRTQAERRAESDEKLLLAAASLIAEEGFNAATFEKIGARAGYSRGLASQRFGSKDGLIEAHRKEIKILQRDALSEIAGNIATVAVPSDNRSRELS